MSQEYQYLNLMQKILDEGEEKKDRTGTGTIGLFGPQIEFDISKEFPLLTTKKINFKAVIHELLWFISGDTNIRYLQDNGIKIWDEWADENGDLGPVYGHQWRKFGSRNIKNFLNTSMNDVFAGGVDQLFLLQESLVKNPESRRHIVSSWNPVDIPNMALPPCHCLFQFYVRNGFLDCKMYQRSADMFLGVPFNIASYALLTYMLAQSVGLKPGRYIHTFGDAHIYLNHIEQVKEQLSRQPRSWPSLYIKAEKKNIFEFNYDDIILNGYDPHPFIKAPISV